MNRPAFALAVGLVLSAASVTRGSPSLAGPSGLITMPTALTLRQSQVDLSFSEWRITPSFGDGKGYTFSDARIGVGLLDLPDSGLELGITKPQATAIGLDNAYVFGKYGIPGMLPGGALAVGGVFSTDKHNYSSVFVVGSSAISKSFALHYGGGVNVYGDPLGWAWYGGRRDNGRADSGFALFGAEFDYRRLKATIDYNGSYLSYGIDFYPDSFFSLSLFKQGRGDYERLLGLDNGVGFGATIRF